MSAAQTYGRYLRLVCSVAVGIGLAWAIAVHTLQAALDRTETAGHRALLAPADALALLSQEPGNARALAALGRSARDGGNAEAAGILMRAAAGRSLREGGPHAWLIADAIERQDWPLAARHIDILMRMNHEAIEPLSPLLTQLAERPASATAVHEIVSKASPWRQLFFVLMLRSIADVRTPLHLMLAMNEGGAPPTTGELEAYLRFLVENRFFDLAYYTWLQFLPAEQVANLGALFNGGFELRPSGSPFDWALQESGPIRAAIARRPDRPSERALLVEFGRGAPGSTRVRQLVRLAAGQYRVSGEVGGEIAGRFGPRWRVECVDGPTSRIGESEMFVGRMDAWRKFTFEIAVPDRGCRAQAISLVLDALSPAARDMSGAVWFDDMAIVRAP